MDSSQRSRIWTFAGCQLDERALELKVGGTVVDLDRKPLQVLLHLLRHAGEVVTKDELAEAVWPGRIITDSNLTKTVAVLRAALGEAGPAAIKTVHGYGYRLVAPVSVQVPAAEAGPPRIALTAGDSPPLRPNWQLVSRLDAGGHGEVWLGRERANGEARAFKFAEGGRALTALKREITLGRLLRETLPDRRDFLLPMDWNLDVEPFFVESEYQPRGNLAAWVTAQGGADALPLPQRIELMAQVAEAAAAAHSVGVLHKDLKPANVLIADDPGAPRIRLADFGSGSALAEALEGRGITRMGFTQTAQADPATSGTPVYLAPEVLAGQPFTVQSDVYALGVMLYQLVAGDLRRALAPGWEKDVPDELLREDIAAAAAGNPADRLGDAGALAVRLRALGARHAERAAQRQREDEARRARRAQSQVRRLQAIAAVLLVATASVVAAGIVALRARDDARRAAATAEAVGEFLNKDVLAGLDPREGPVQDLSLLGVLHRASATVDTRFASEPAAAAKVHHQLGEVYVQLGELPRAREHLQAAMRLYGEGTLAAIDAGWVLAQAMALAGDPAGSCALVGRLARLSDRPDAGTERLLTARTEGLVCASNLGSGGDRSGEAAAIVAAFEEAGLTASREYERALAALVWNLEVLGRFAEAEGHARKLVRHVAAVAGEHHLRTARRRDGLAEVLINLGKLDEADAELARSLEDQIAWGGGVERRSSVYCALAILRIEQGAFAASEKAGRQCLDGPYGAAFSGVWPSLVEALLEQGRFDEATATARGAVERIRGVEQSLKWYQVRLFASWADALRRKGQSAAAWRVLEDMTDAERAGINDDNRAVFDRVRGLLLLHDGKRAEGLAALERALEGFQRLPAPPDYWRLVQVRKELASARGA